MKIAFADTSYYIAVLGRTDVHHQQAMKITQQHRGGQVVTSEWVLCEVANYLSLPQTRRLVLQLIRDIDNSPDATIVRSDATLFDAGLDLYSRRLEKSWSLTDCISFEIMRDRGITDAWTADHHFVQAGFNALLM